MQEAIDAAIPQQTQAKENTDDVMPALVPEKSSEPTKSYGADDAKFIALLEEPIYFDLNKSNLRPESIRILDRKVEVMKRYPEMKIVIFGNTCNLGNEISNTKLGHERADSARKYMISKGIASERVQAKTQASFDPEQPNTDEYHRQFNRRCDFTPIFPKMR
jgi:outer membrane protein OmpA-like peptidoglycan-associated protein